MSENQLADLYIEDGNGGFIGIDPRTIAIAVKDESKEDGNVQDFINELDATSVRYLNEWNATNQVDFSSIRTPVKKGYTYKVIGTETSFGNRTYKPGDFLIINKNINHGVISEQDVDVLLGYGNEGSKINRYVADVVENYTSLLEYENPVIDSVIIVANDETHNNLLSYYDYKESNEPPYAGWTYMFSRHELTDGIFKVKGSVRSYSDLPRQEQEVGDVYNVLDTGANYVWTQDGWDKLSETVDLSNYYTKSETYNKSEVNELIREAGILPPQEGNEGKFLSTDGSLASWEDIPASAIIRNWD